MLVVHNVGDAFVVGGPFNVSALTAEPIYTDGKPGLADRRFRPVVPWRFLRIPAASGA